MTFPPLLDGVSVQPRCGSVRDLAMNDPDYLDLDHDDACPDGTAKCGHGFYCEGCRRRAATLVADHQALQGLREEIARYDALVAASAPPPPPPPPDPVSQAEKRFRSRSPFLLPPPGDAPRAGFYADGWDDL